MVFDFEKFTRFVDTERISTSNRREIRAYIERNAKMPDLATLMDITGMQFEGRRGDQFYEAALAYAEQFIQESPEIQKKIEERAAAEGKSVEDFFWDESKIHEPGTKEADLFDFYRGMGETQHEIGRTELARSERDMQVEMAQQRQQLVDEVRKRRQNQLRSGLSSAQIANEEIQMLLMGQQAQQQTAQGYFDQRTGMQQQHQMNPYMAELQTRQHIQGGMQGATGMYAAYTGDPIATSRSFGTSDPWLQEATKRFLSEDDD